MIGQKKHILLSSMGISGPRETCYTKNGEESTSEFSAFGLWQLLPEDQRPSEVWFLLTPKAEEVAWSGIKKEAQALGVKVCRISLQEEGGDDTRSFLETVAEKIPEECQLTLDITQGLRHHAFLFYALALYLSEFRGIQIEGAWYCRLETEIPDAPKPVIDLKPVLDLAYWFHALGVFRETGSLRVLAKLIDNNKKTAEAFEAFSSFFLTGMPIEAGDQATQLLAQMSPDRDCLPKIPLVNQIVRRINDELKPLAGSSCVGANKKGLLLDRDELKRQANYIDYYLESDQLNLAFGLMREWVVSFVLSAGPNDQLWLNYKKGRAPTEHLLGGLGALLCDKGNPARESLTDEQRKWAKLWNDLCSTRNALQHHGMKPEPFSTDSKVIIRLKKSWEDLRTWSCPPQFGGGKGKLLICPIGMTPGVLYSAIKRMDPVPDRVLVICSEESVNNIDGAIEKTGSESEVQRLRMNDVFTGIRDFDSLLKNASTWIYEADEIHVNLTGGTTLMGVLAGRLSGRAEREYQRPVREFVLIDKRSPEAQRDDPWELADIHYLDDRPAAKGEDNSDRDSSQETKA